MSMKIAIIVATDEQGLIGSNNDLPWKIPADLKYFRAVTMGKPLIMGRNTHESIGIPLPGRENIIVTHNKEYFVEGCKVVHSVKQALEICKNKEEVMVIGGASLYEQLLPMADRIYLTQVHAKIEHGDTWFPLWDKKAWQQVQRQDYLADEKNDYPYSFIVYDRR